METIKYGVPLSNLRFFVECQDLETKMSGGKRGCDKIQVQYGVILLIIT